MAANEKSEFLSFTNELDQHGYMKLIYLVAVLV